MLPFDLKEQIGTYADTHKAAVMVLNMMGLKIDPKFRLPLFRLTVKLDEELKDRPETAEARRLLARLLKLRTQGKEPPHKSGVYLPRSMDEL